MTRVYWIIGFLLVAAAVAAPAWLYPGLPDRIPTHWNIEGKVDGYGGKWTLFVFPVLMVGMLVLFYFLPALSPKHFEVDTFRPTYLYIMDVVLGLFGYMQGVLLYTVYQGVHGGATVDLGRGFIAGIFLFFALDGQPDGEGAEEFLYRRARALDPGQRSRLERYASPGGLGDVRGGRGRVHPGRLGRVDRHPDRPAGRRRL